MADPTKPEVLDVPGEERIGKTRTIYDVRISEIFFRNFIAGLARGLGGFAVYIVLLGIVSLGIINFVLPKLKPVFDTYTNIGNSMNNFPQFRLPSIR